MIRYERTLYGFSYLFRCTGSELPRCLPWVIASGIIGGVFASGASDQLGWPIRDYFGHPYAMQVLGLVFGYLSITRLNVSYNRYWEGCSHVKVMHSKWSVAALQLLAFDRVSAHETALRDEPFCMHLIRLFKQLSGVAIMKLHVEDWDHFFAEDEDPAHPALVNPPLARHSDPPSLAESFHGSFHESFIRRTRRASFTEEERLTKKREADVQKLFTPAEADFYRRAPDAVSAAVSRICRALTTRQLAGGMAAPSPMVARVLQDLSMGLEAYQSASKMTEVPVPFAYAQINALLLFIFNALTPIAIACFSSPDAAPAPTDDVMPLEVATYDRTLHVLVSVVLSMVVSTGFTAMWLVANEIEVRWSCWCWLWRGSGYGSGSAASVAFTAR